MPEKQSQKKSKTLHTTSPVKDTLPQNDSFESQMDVNPAHLTPQRILQLQRTIGNQRTMRLLQTMRHQGAPQMAQPADDLSDLTSSAKSRQADTRAATPPNTTPTIQRLMTEQALLMNAGDPDKDPILGNLTTAVAEYHEANANGAGVETLVSYLNVIISFAQKWLSTNPVQGGHNADQARTAKLIPNLLRGAQREREALQKGEQKTIDKSDKALIGTQDIKYEILAHYVAYKGTGGAMSDLLKKWGFEPAFRRTVQGNGFFVGLLMPAKNRPDVHPVLAFKGTTQTSTGDISADLDPVAVGFTTFQRHKSEVADLISEAGGSVDVVGHSLGGALAQHCAVSFNTSVRRAITFQAAPISGTQALMFRAMRNKPSVTHHVAKGDVVPSGGIAHLKGEGFLHDTGKSALGAHTTYLFTAPEFKEDREAAGLSDEVLAQLGLDKHLRDETHAPVKHSKSHPTSGLKKLGGEVGRQLGAVILGIPLFIASMFQKYPSIPMQDSTIENNAYAAATPIFQSYKKEATSKRWFGLAKAKGISVSGVSRAVKKALKKDPAFKKFAGAARGIERAAIDVLGIKSIKITGDKVTEISL